MLVVSLLAAALGACPGELETAVSGVQEGTSCAIGDLPSPMTVDVLCSAATDENRCCRISSAESSPKSKCFPTYTGGPPYSCVEKPPTENPIHTFSFEETTYWSMRCPGDTSATTSEQPTTDAEISCTSDLKAVFQGEAEGKFCDLDVTLTQLRELSADPDALAAAICSAATDENKCCRIDTGRIAPASECFANFDHSPLSNQCNEEIFTYKHQSTPDAWGDGTAWSVCCPGGPCDTTSSTSNEPTTKPTTRNITKPTADTTKATTNPTDKSQPPVADLVEDTDNPCPSQDYPVRGWNADAEMCCTDNTFATCYGSGPGETDYCTVSYRHRCCFPDFVYTGAVCSDLFSKEDCDRDPVAQWCGDAEPTTADTTKAVEEDYVYEKGGCDHLDDFTTRVTQGETITNCCRPDTPQFSDCYIPQPGSDLCTVATPTFPCCYTGLAGYYCSIIPTAAACKTLQEDPRISRSEWCGDAEDTKDTLPPAAIAGIVVGAVVLIVAIAAFVYF